MTWLNHDSRRYWPTTYAIILFAVLPLHGFCRLPAPHEETGVTISMLLRTLREQVYSEAPLQWAAPFLVMHASTSTLHAALQTLREHLLPAAAESV